MRSTKMFSFAATVALVAMVALGASTASAGSTALCGAHEDPCLEDPLAAVHLELAEGTIFQLLSSVSTILCLEVLATAGATEGTTGNPLPLQMSLSFANCGSNSAHSNCTISAIEQPVVELLRTSLNLATLSGTSEQPGVVNVQCTIIGFPVDCDYSGEELTFPVEGAEHTEGAGNGRLVAEKTPAKLTEALGGFFCPENSTLDFSLEALEPTYVVSEADPLTTALCATHASTGCAEKDLLDEVHLESTQPVSFLNSVADIECESSSLEASLLGLGNGKPQEAHVTEWSWKGCHTLGATGNCSVETAELPDIGIERTELNVAIATLEVEIAVECLVLGLHEMECSYGGTLELPLEGALRKVATPHGKLEADRIDLKRIEEGTGCAPSAEWDATFEPLEHVYIVS